MADVVQAGRTDIDAGLVTDPYKASVDVAEVIGHTEDIEVVRAALTAKCPPCQLVMVSSVELDFSRVEIEDANSCIPRILRNEEYDKPPTLSAAERRFLPRSPPPERSGGLTTFAKRVACDPAVQSHFSGGVLYVEVGAPAAEREVELSCARFELGVLLGGAKDARFHSDIHWHTTWRHWRHRPEEAEAAALAEKPVLLILDDVCTPDQLRSFWAFDDELGGRKMPLGLNVRDNRCRVLMTTRAPKELLCVSTIGLGFYHHVLAEWTPEQGLEQMARSAGPENEDAMKALVQSGRMNRGCLGVLVSPTEATVAGHVMRACADTLRRVGKSDEDTAQLVATVVSPMSVSRECLECFRQDDWDPIFRDPRLSESLKSTFGLRSLGTHVSIQACRSLVDTIQFDIDNHPPDCRAARRLALMKAAFISLGIFPDGLLDIPLEQVKSLWRMIGLNTKEMDFALENLAHRCLIVSFSAQTGVLRVRYQQSVCARVMVHTGKIGRDLHRLLAFSGVGSTLLPPPRRLLRVKRCGVLFPGCSAPLVTHLRVGTHAKGGLDTLCAALLPKSDYARRYVISHLLAGGMPGIARELLLSFDWLLGYLTGSLASGVARVASFNETVARSQQRIQNDDESDCMSPHQLIQSKNLDNNRRQQTVKDQLASQYDLWEDHVRGRIADKGIRVRILKPVGHGKKKLRPFKCPVQNGFVENVSCLKRIFERIDGSREFKEDSDFNLVRAIVDDQLKEAILMTIAPWIERSLGKTSASPSFFFSPLARLVRKACRFLEFKGASDELAVPVAWLSMLDPQLLDPVERRTEEHKRFPAFKHYLEECYGRGITLGNAWMLRRRAGECGSALVCTNHGEVCLYSVAHSQPLCVWNSGGLSPLPGAEATHAPRTVTSLDADERTLLVASVPQGLPPAPTLTMKVQLIDLTATTFPSPAANKEGTGVLTEEITIDFEKGMEIVGIEISADRAFYFVQYCINTKNMPFCVWISRKPSPGRLGQNTRGVISSAPFCYDKPVILNHSGSTFLLDYYIHDQRSVNGSARLPDGMTSLETTYTVNATRFDSTALGELAPMDTRTVGQFSYKQSDALVQAEHGPLFELMMGFRREYLVGCCVYLTGKAPLEEPLARSTARSRYEESAVGITLWIVGPSEVGHTVGSPKVSLKSGFVEDFTTTYRGGDCRMKSPRTHFSLLEILNSKSLCALNFDTSMYVIDVPSASFLRRIPTRSTCIPHQVVQDTKGRIHLLDRSTEEQWWMVYRESDKPATAPKDGVLGVAEFESVGRFPAKGVSLTADLFVDSCDNCFLRDMRSRNTVAQPLHDLRLLNTTIDFSDQGFEVWDVMFDPQMPFLGKIRERRPCDEPSCSKERRHGMVKLLFCAGCGLVAYCSKKCQTKHWRKHKAICRLTTFASKDIDDDLLRCIMGHLPVVDRLRVAVTNKQFLKVYINAFHTPSGTAQVQTTSVWCDDHASAAVLHSWAHIVYALIPGGESGFIHPF